MELSMWFRKMCLACLLFAAILAIPSLPLWAEEEKPTGDLSVSVLSQYIWRGYELSRNSVVIEPSMTLGYKGFSANFWGNLDTKPYSPVDKSYDGTWNETDFTLSYTKTLGLFNISGGYSYYSLASLNEDAADRNDSQELSASASLNILLSPTLVIYKEISHYRYWYFLIGISHVVELNKMVSLKLAASAGYLLSTDADTCPEFDGNALATTDKFKNFHDGSVSVSLPIRITNNFMMTPTLSYIFPLITDARNEIRGVGLKGTANPAERDNSFIVGGMTASFLF